MNPCLKMFIDEIQTKINPTVIELGTRRWGDKPTHHKEFWPHAKHIGVDYLEGLDVDIVADAHQLSQHFSVNSIDAIFSASTFEHLHSPWIAANEMLKILKPGGIVFVQTHQTFPIHGYPYDYFRFTTQGMRRLFQDYKMVESVYEFPCKIIPNEKLSVWYNENNSFLNVVTYARKPS